MQRLTCAGVTLEDEQAVQPCATLQLSYRMCGGGGDGGSTGAESRSCYLEMYKGKQVWSFDLRLLALDPPCIHSVPHISRASYFRTIK